MPNTTRYILGTYDKTKFEKYCEILNHYAVGRFNPKTNGLYFLATREETNYHDFYERKFYSVDAEVMVRDISKIKRLVRIADLPSSSLAKYLVDSDTGYSGLEVAA